MKVCAPVFVNWTSCVCWVDAKTHTYTHTLIKLAWCVLWCECNADRESSFPLCFFFTALPNSAPLAHISWAVSGCEQSVIHLHLELKLASSGPEEPLVLNSVNTPRWPDNFLSRLMQNYSSYMSFMHNIRGTGEAAPLHEPFISLQSLPPPISIARASADDSHQCCDWWAGEQAGCFLSTRLNHLRLSLQESKCMKNPANKKCVLPFCRFFCTVRAAVIVFL